MLTLSSSAFTENGSIPDIYTCDADNINPPLSIAGVPPEAKSLVLIMDDPDIPQFAKDRLGVEVFDHWIVFDIPPETKEIAENQAPPGVQGMGSMNPGYAGPCPPDKEHRYFFKLFALDAWLGLPAGARREDVERAMQGHIIETAMLLGRYLRREHRGS